MTEIITVGEILVEIMAKNIDQSFEETGVYRGPYPSGAPAIFIDQAAKTGSTCAIVSMVGNDGFGRMNKQRLQSDGVDIQYIGVNQEKTTGIAFVAYKENGERDFIFTTKDSAAAALTRNEIKEEMFEGCKYLHINGCSVFSEEMIEVFDQALSFAKAKRAQVSFDPNFRKEMMGDSRFKEFFLRILGNCHIFLPGEDELRWITGIDEEEQAVRSVMNQKARMVIVKRGSRGCRVYEREGYLDIEPFHVKEADPTGAGDCFAGTFISLLNQGKSAYEAAQYANAAGACAVMTMGPMEGTTSLSELQEFMSR